MLTSKQRAYLKSLAQSEKVTFQIGKDGLNENMLNDVLAYLNKHEIIKISILLNSSVTAVEAEAFFEKHGAPAIILARYMPIIRTFAPFAAAGSGFPYRRFIRYSIVGCVSWVAICCSCGYFFGNLPFVQAHFSAIILAIIVVTLMPAVISFIKSKLSNKSAQVTVDSPLNQTQEQDGE